MSESVVCVALKYTEEEKKRQNCVDDSTSTIHTVCSSQTMLLNCTTTTVTADTISVTITITV